MTPTPAKRSVLTTVLIVTVGVGGGLLPLVTLFIFAGARPEQAVIAYLVIWGLWMLSVAVWLAWRKYRGVADSGR
jgi:Na+/melibiose symporter-like transporter